MGLLHFAVGHICSYIYSEFGHYFGGRLCRLCDVQQ
jgi:hypothetical protein